MIYTHVLNRGGRGSEARRTAWARVGAFVDGAKVCQEVFADPEALARAEDEAELSLSEAAVESGLLSSGNPLA